MRVKKVDVMTSSRWNAQKSVSSVDFDHILKIIIKKISAQNGRTDFGQGFAAG